MVLDFNVTNGAILIAMVNSNVFFRLEPVAESKDVKMYLASLHLVSDCGNHTSKLDLGTTPETQESATETCQYYLNTYLLNTYSSNVVAQ